MMTQSMRIRFWGVRGSHPVPGSETVQFGGNTACVEVQAGDHTLILDAGTGIIALGRALAARTRPGSPAPGLFLLLSHLHHDHTQGLPFFAPAYNPAVRLHIVGPGPSASWLESQLGRNQATPFFPVSLDEMRSGKQIQAVLGGETLAADRRGLGAAAGEAGQVSIRTLRSYAHPGGVLVYRLEWRGRSLVYATDTEGYAGADQRLAAFARGADVLIHDAQYSEDHYYGRLAGTPPTQGYGHSTTAMACELAAAAGVGALVLFHHDPAYSDAMIHAQEQAARDRFPQAQAAREGLVLELEAGSPARPAAVAHLSRPTRGG